VAILTPPQSHADIGCDALEAGKHLFIDKPLALTHSDCRRLIERAERSSRHAMLGFNLRWHRLVLGARQIIQSGVLGRIKALASRNTHPLPLQEDREWMRHRDSGGGVIHSEAIHHFDLWRFLLQSRVVQATVTSQSSDRYEDESITMTGQMSDGALLSGLFALGTSGSNQIEIFGEHGRLSLSLYRYDGLEFFSYSEYEGDLMRRVQKSARTLAEIPKISPALRQGGAFPATFLAEWRHFVSCLRTDSTPQCTLQDGLRALETALACSASAASGLPVRLETK
jgi:predicted dehydrogenase